MPTAIIALEDSDVMIVPTKFIREYLESNPEFNLRFVQSLFSQAYGIILNGYYYSPLQRYRQLVERFPRILELVPLGEIASYLNISAVSSIGFGRLPTVKPIDTLDKLPVFAWQIHQNLFLLQSQKEIAVSHIH